MAETVSGTRFRELVVQSGLVKEDTVARYRDVGDELVSEKMIEDGLLTRFQAKQLQSGRHRGFFIGQKYKILDLLGKGGMSRVVLCEHLMLQRLVAVKLMDPALEKLPGASDRFVREARAAAAVDHGNIARLYDVDRSPTGLYMVMEYIDGVNLQELVTWHGALAPARAAHYIRQAADGLQHAHEAGLVHRDVKPGNLMLTRNGVVKLLDLGLARFFDTRRNDSLTSTFDPDAVLGTADFIAPEQVTDSSKADIRSDIYSLGCTLYFLLLRKLPTDEGTTMQKLLWHQTRQPIPLRSIRPEIPEELEAVVDRMIRKNPADRYQTPAEVSAALVQFVNEPVALPAAAEMPEQRLSGYRCFLPPQSTTPTPEARLTSSCTAIPTDIVPRPKSLSAAMAGKETLRQTSGDTKGGSGLTGRSSAPQTESVPSEASAQMISRQKRLAWILASTSLVFVLTLAGILLPRRFSNDDRNANGPANSADANSSSAAVAPPPVSAVTIRGGGSTFAKPIMDHWAAIYEREKGKRVEYVAQGSSKGVEGVLARFLDFGCSDAPLSDTQLQEVRSGGSGGVVHVPLVMGAVVPTFNLVDAKGSPIPLRFTGPLLANIYLGKVTKWNDEALAANNPGVTLPEMAIKVVYRKDGSGTTHIWTDYLSKASSAWKGQVGVGNKVGWPVGEGAEKNNGVADMVSRNSGAIGYVELSYALANDLPVGIVKNRDGHYVKASVESITSAAMGSWQTIPDDLRYSLTDASGPDAYPIVGTTWALLHLDQPQAKQQELVEFLTWATGDGQRHVGQLHYGRLPAEFTPKIHAALRKIR